MMNEVEQIPYDDSQSDYQRTQEETRSNRRLVALEEQVEKLKGELERKNTRLSQDGLPIPYTRRKYGDFSR